MTRRLPLPAEPTPRMSGHEYVRAVKIAPAEGAVTLPDIEDGAAALYEVDARASGATSPTWDAFVQSTPVQADHYRTMARALAKRWGLSIEGEV